MVARIKTITILSIILFGFSFPCYAAAKSTWWDQHEEEYTSLSKAKDCNGIWNLLWPEAKAGNLEARFVLFFHVFFPMHSDRITLPGHKFNYADWIRDSLILAIHSLGIYELKELKGEEKIDTLLYSQYLIPKLPNVSGPHDEFLNCVNNKRSKQCTKIAVRDGIVPTFEEFAKNIDILVAQGVKPSCDFAPDEDAVDISPKDKN